MKASEVVKEFLTDIEKNDFKKAENLAAKNFVVEGVGPTNLSITEFLGVHRSLNTGLPDFRFNHKIERETTDQVNVTVQLSGTHKNDMQAPIPGLGTIKATNKSVKMPLEKVVFTVKNDKITNMKLQEVSGGGLPGLLKQIGVDIHQHAQ